MIYLLKEAKENRWLESYKDWFKSLSIKKDLKKSREGNMSSLWKREVTKKNKNILQG